MAYRTTSWKNTDIGWVPSDWEVKDLRCINNVSMCKRVMKYQTKSVGVIPFYKISTFGGIPDSFIDRDLYEYLRSNFSYPNRGDILFSAAGTIGKYIIFDGNPAYFQDSNIVWIHNDERLVLNSYLYQLYHVIQWCTSEGGIVSRLYNKDIVNLKISIPSLLEQQKIAEVLTDLDDLIVELEKLRDKKQAIKIGAMQELLTGKRRLSGFNKPWKKVELGEIADLLKGRGLSKDKVDPKGRYSCVLYGELFTIYKEKIAHVISKTDYEEGVFSKEGDVLVPGSTTTTGIDLAKASALLQGGVLLGGDINIIRIKERDINPIFLAYLITNTQKNEIGNIAKGTTVYHLHGTDLAVLIIYIPMDKSEQTAIANILSDMDDEISAINDKINKYKQIKAGVADELLSGRIRLIKPQE